jgi:hypothetical protein
MVGLPAKMMALPAKMFYGNNCRFPSKHTVERFNLKHVDLTTKNDDMIRIFIGIRILWINFVTTSLRLHWDDGW